MPYTRDALITEYEQRRQQRLEVVAQLDRRHHLYGNVRLALAGAAILTVWLGGEYRWWGLGLEFVLFIVLINVHARLIDTRDQAQRAVEFYVRGLQRIRHEWLGRGDAGERFRSPGVWESGGPSIHSYADDLDIFGRGSAFELIGTCRTEVGQVTVARWLLEPADRATALARQDAVRELTPLLDLREHLNVEGAVIGTRLHPDRLREWAAAAPVLSSSVYRALAFMLPVLFATSIAWRQAGGPGGVTEILLFAQIGFAALLRPRVLKVINAVDTPSRDLELMVRTAETIETASFTSPLLRRLQTQLRGGDAGRSAASQAIGRLSRLVTRLAERKNVFFAPLAAAMLWATHCAFAIEGWRRDHGRHVPDWLDAIGEVEALAALAGFAAEHPAFTFPTMRADSSSRFSARQLGHPLLDESAVANDVALGGDDPALMLVSGSNMSGKSTFLRTIGLSVVLARMGAPVRADACELSSLSIGASIRINDSLQDGRSRFFAEILRLRQVVDLARTSGGQTIFLLDEMLSGTNSHDRRQGAEGVLKGLIALGAIGLATTHDLALGAIATAQGAAATQMHFSDVFDAGTLQFDYVLRPGPVRTSNALALMRSVGLEVDIS